MSDLIPGGCAASDHRTLIAKCAPSMTKEELLAFSGTVIEQHPNGMFRVKLENDQEIIATLKGKIRRFRFRIMVGDRVEVEVTPYDLTKGRINFWHR